MEANKARETAILFGLLLSKFGMQALRAFGFRSYRQAYNAIGYATGVPPASVKNYRDEFDPHFDNPRRGWHGRRPKAAYMNYLDTFGGETLEVLVTHLQMRLFPVQTWREIGLLTDEAANARVAQRLITGKAAEMYFLQHYTHEPRFRDCVVRDTTLLACGYDFVVEASEAIVCYVEVKGLQGTSGTVSLTEKEYHVASLQQENYCLFLVCNFNERPYHRSLFDPLRKLHNLRAVEERIVRTTYVAHLDTRSRVMPNPDEAVPGT